MATLSRSPAFKQRFTSGFAMLTPAARGLEQEPDATLGLVDPKNCI
jgi:hypothetical protein